MTESPPTERRARMSKDGEHLACDSCGFRLADIERLTHPRHRLLRDVSFDQRVRLGQGYDRRPLGEPMRVALRGEWHEEGEGVWALTETADALYRLKRVMASEPRNLPPHLAEGARESLVTEPMSNVGHSWRGFGRSQLPMRVRCPRCRTENGIHWETLTGRCSAQ